MATIAIYSENIQTTDTFCGQNAKLLIVKAVVQLIDYDGVRLTSQNCIHHWPIVHTRVNVIGQPWW
jgi:uncharacterized membrane protein